jgi:hypothetical protein
VDFGTDCGLKRNDFQVPGMMAFEFQGSAHGVLLMRILITT